MYCSEVEFDKRFGEDERLQAVQTNGGLTYASAAEDADALVDSYLAAIPGRTFPLPLTTPPARIIGLAADLTRYELWANRASEEITKRRDQAVDFLKDLVAGRAALILTAVDDGTQGPSPKSRVGYRANGRTFHDDSLAGFVGSGASSSEDWRP